MCALLRTVDSAEFGTVRNELGISDSVLSERARVPAASGYVRIGRATVASRQRTWLALTGSGRDALDGHVAELRRLLDAGPGRMSG